MSYAPTPEQAAIIDAAREGHNLVIQAWLPEPARPPR